MSNTLISPFHICLVRLIEESSNWSLNPANGSYINEEQSEEARERERTIRASLREFLLGTILVG